MNRDAIYALRARTRLDQYGYHQALLLLADTFVDPGNKLERVRGLARSIKFALEHISPLIQDTTRTVCPKCSDVCCISKHGFYNYEDIVYLSALGLRPPLIDFNRDDNDPCQFLTENGCSTERSLRPSGCNWYFCVPLLEVIEKRPYYRAFDDSLRDLAEMWLKMIADFSKASRL